MKKRMLSIVMALIMILSLLPVTAMAAVTEVDDSKTYFDDTTDSFRLYKDYWADIVEEEPEGYATDDKTVTISSAEALVWWAEQVNRGTSFTGYTVSITDDIDLSGHYWTPIDTATIQFTEKDGKVSWTTVDPQKKLDGVTIDGGGHTITGLATATGIRGPAQPSDPGDGQNCYYYSAFIGRNDGTLTIQNITFDKASIAMTEPAEGVASNGTSMCAVVTAISSGALTLDCVTVSNSKVFAMQKASALLGMPSGGSFTVNQCAVTGCDIKGYFQVAPIVGYVGTKNFLPEVNGIILDNNTVTIVKQNGWNYAGYTDGIYYGHDDYYGANKYYIGASETAVMDNTAAVSVDGASYKGAALALVAEVDGYQYSTLAAAIDAAQDGQTVKLLKDFTENNLPNATKTMTLDLNGHTLTTNRLVSQGDLTIVDSTVTEEPVVSNDYGTVTYESGKIKVTGTAVYAAFGGTVTLKSGTIESDYLGAYVQGDTTGAETISSTFNVEGGYIIAQEFAATTQGKGATLNISGGVLVAKDNAVVAGNGTKNAQKDLGGTAIEISGGTMIGHIISSGYIACGVYHPQQGELTISGGTIYADGGVGVLMRAGSASITGGTITATGTGSGKVGDSRIIQNCYGIIYDEESNYPGMTDSDKVVISGDAQIGADPAASCLYVWESADTLDRIMVEGGYFTSDPSDYLVDGKAAVESDKDGYNYMVAEATQAPAEVVVAAPSVALPALEGEDLTAAEAVKSELESSANLVTGAGLTAAAGTVANDNAITTEEGKKDLEADGVTVAEGDEVTIVIQPYMDVKIVDLSTADTTLILDITPMYKTVATTDKDNIKLGDNAVEIGTPKPLTITKPVTVTVPLPAGFLTDGTGNVYVKHTKDGAFVGYHKAAVSGTTLTFTNDKGFSTFEIKVDSRTAVVDFGGETGQITYTPVNVGDTLPSATSAGQVFDGWTFAGIEGTYKTLTDELLDQLSAAYAAGSGAAIKATAAFHTPSSGGGGGGVSSYAITVEATENGAVTADKKSAAEDAEITLTVKPNEGYVLESLAVTDKDGKEIALTDKGEGVYTFAMPASKVTVKATFAEAPVSSELPFTDVDVDDWFYGAVEYVYNNKLMDGTSSTAFSPLMTTTRSMIVTILWRLEGQPQVNYAMTFEDVAGDTWYTEAVRWAASEGIVKGYSDTVFAPDDIVSREQLATILDRYAQYKEYDVTAKGDLTTFVDGDTVSSWAADGMTWAVGAELITGKDGGKLDPTGTATRAEVATMLMRFCENVAK